MVRDARSLSVLYQSPPTYVEGQTLSQDPADMGPSQPRRPRPPTGAPKRPGANLRPCRRPAIPTDPRSGPTRDGLGRRRPGLAVVQAREPRLPRLLVRPSSKASIGSPWRRDPNGGNGSSSAASALASLPSFAASLPPISMREWITPVPSQASNGSSPAPLWARPSAGFGSRSKPARTSKRRWPASPRSSTHCS